MFGNLLGTLQRFRQDESRVKDRELKKREVEKKIEEKTEKEKEEARNHKRQLFGERKRQQHELKILQVTFTFTILASKNLQCWYRRRYV